MVCDDDENMEGKLFFSDSNINPTMDSSDEDFLPDPERPRQEKPPDKSKVSSRRGLKRKNDEPANQQRGLILHDDFTEGKCFFIFT